MFRLRADKIHLRVLEREQLTSGSQKIFRAAFEFDEAWKGLDVTTVFRAGKISRETLLTGGQCEIPWEVLAMANETLWCGVYGTRPDGIVMPTIWAELGRIQPGARKVNRATQPPKDIYAEILNKASEAERIAQDLADRAERGEFDGEQGPAGPVGPAGQDGQNGQDGFSPVVTVTDIEGGHRVSITDELGTQSFDVLDGAGGTGGESVQSDWGQSDPEAEDYIRNRTHWEETEEVRLEWEYSDTEGREHFDGAYNMSQLLEYYKIWDSFLSEEEIRGMTGELYISSGGTFSEVDMGAEYVGMIYPDAEIPGNRIYYVHGSSIELYVAEAGAEVSFFGQTFTIPSGGVYARHIPNHYKLEIFGTVTTVKKIDRKFLPSDAALPEVSDADNGKFLSVTNGKWELAALEVWEGGSY